jgi:hypothetical protein
VCRPLLPLRTQAGKRYKYRVVVTSKCARHIRVHAVAVDLPQVTLMYAPTLLAPVGDSCACVRACVRARVCVCVYCSAQWR